MILGIDLGTTYSLGAYLDEQGVPHIVNNLEGATATPSVVLFDTKDNIIVGEIAKSNAIIRTQDVISVVKNYMGKKLTLRETDGKNYTPEMISSFIIRKIVQDAAAILGTRIEGIVITVPAYFTDAQRKATEDAAVMAGSPLLGIINEPTAAALCYAEEHHIQNKHLLIYDLGGGTFDVTIVHVNENQKIEVKSTGGLSNAGGRFFDQSIVDYVRQQIARKYDIDLEDEEYEDELQELYLKAENTKMQLSSKKNASIVLKIGKIKEQIEISRELFESMIQKVYIRTENKIKDALKVAGLHADDIDKILLVGGSSRIPYIAQGIHALLGQEPSKEINPDEAVAIGAAIYANMLKNGTDIKQFVDVCSHSIGVVVINDKNQEENELIIPRNSKLPIEREQRFRTVVKNQRVINLTVTEGEYQELSDVTVVGTFPVDLPSGLAEQTLVILKISLDTQQLIHIKIELPDVGFEQEYHMKRLANMDEGAVQHITGMLRDYTVS